MSNRDLSLALRLYADASRFVSGLVTGERGVRHFASTARQEFDKVKQIAGSVQGQLAALGLTTGTVATLMQSARMDKSLGQIGQTAGVSRAEVTELRKELFRMAAETGQPVDQLKQGFDSAVQAGLAFREALPVIDAVNVGMAVTSASADRLTAGLTVAATAFNFDLAKPGKALDLLDKMTAAGRLGRAELGNLSDIFARVGVSAASGGLGFEQTLAFIEGLSYIEGQPERLATLADSTLRLFTNLHYMKEAAQATHVRFFEKDGKRRDPIAVLRDIKAQYDKLNTDKERALYIQKAFGKADLDTIKGMRTLLGGDMLDKVGQFSKDIAAAGGTLKHDLDDAISNSIDQVGRLQAVLRKSADDFARPINDAIQSIIKWGLDKKDKGGLGLTGKEIAAGATLGAVGIYGAARLGGAAVGTLAKRFGGTAAGVAQGKALEAAAGVTPVFVVNWPGSPLGGGLADGAAAAAGGAATAGTFGKVASRAKSLAVLAGGLPASAWLSMGARGMATAAGGVGAAAAGGYAVGSGINYAMSAVLSAIAGREQTLGGLIYDMVHAEPQKVGGEIRVRVDQDGRVMSVRAASDNRDVPFNIDAGMTMVAP